MSDRNRPVFEDFERLVPIRILGCDASVPADNPLLRGFQYLCPDAVAHGRFCWNHECGNSKFYYRLPGEAQERKARACRFEPVENMEITRLSPELKHVLRAFLEARAVAASPLSPDAGPGEEEDPFPEIRFKGDG
jgi:hypothetical protein